MKCPDCFNNLTLEDELDDSTLHCLVCHPKEGMYMSYSGARYRAEFRKYGQNPCIITVYGETALEAEINLKAGIKDIYKTIFNLN